MTQDIPLVDMALFKDARQMMQQKFSKILGYYFEDTQSYIDTIRQGIEQKDVSMVIPAAHTIKSSSRQLGAILLSNTAAKLEEEGRCYLKKGDDFEAIRELAEKLIPLFVSTKKYMETQE